ncbi:MAG: hypothetical protein H7Y22_08180 [Gemmatimonadaceae bacterium]|nr:hypothetical protein [Gloeobacterales cyanobacterium ES-bin-141]
MDVRFFNTENGMVLYHYLGLGTTHDQTCHVWEVWVYKHDQTLTSGTSCIPVVEGYELSRTDARVDALLL